MAVANSNPFALAIASFISDIKRNEDIRSPFYREVLGQINNRLLEKGSAAESKQCADHLDVFIRDLERKLKRDSKTLWITDKLRPLVSGLAQYTSACDIMIQATPCAAVVLYGGARLVLQLGQNFYNCFDTVLSIMEKIGHLLQCYHLFSNAYQSSADMQDLLVKSYKKIVSFWQKASKLLSRKLYKTLLVGIVKPLGAEWQECRQGLEDDSTHVRMLAQATEADFRRQKDLGQAVHRQSEMRKHIVDWIKAGEDDDKLDIRGDIRVNMDIRHENTCEWLFQHPDMEKWLGAKKTAALWYSAPPGAGKTILASAVARQLQDKGLKTATFFYSFNDMVRKKPITALRCIALQVLTHLDPIPDKVKRLYEEDLMNHCFKLNDLMIAAQVVEALIKQVSRVHIIVDGLDECQERQQLFNSFCQLLEVRTYGIVKWFLASRAERDIRASMREHGVTEIEAPQDSLMSDIRRYVADYFKGKLGHDCENCIEHWTSQSEGNFLWTTLMLRIMEGEDLTCEEEIEEELNKFPKGLTGCYIRSLAQLSKRPERHQQLARRIFTMIVGAVQPLHLSELSHALATTAGLTDYSSKKVPRLQLIEELCSNLVVFDRTSKGSESDPLLKIAHKSIQDFFLQDPNSLGVPDDLRQYFVSGPAANLELGHSCLAYLRYVRYHQPQDVSTIIEPEDHAFLRHAATFWHWYLTYAKHSDELFNQVADFVQSPAFWTCVAVQSRIAPHLFARYSKIADGNYQLEGTGPKQEEEADNVSYAIPLPEWLDEYAPSGPQMVQAFYSFVREWHPVLNSHPSAADQCVMDQRWESNMPGRTAWLSGRVKFSSLSSDEAGPSNVSTLSVMDVTVHSGGIMVAVFGNQILCEGSHPQWLHLLITSESVSPYLGSRPTMPVSAEFSRETYIFSTTYAWAGPYSLIDLSCLRVQQYDRKEGDAGVLARVSDTLPPEAGAEKWRLVCKATGGTYDGFASYQRAVAFHCSLDLTGQDNASSRYDSGFGSSNSDGDSDPDLSDDSASASEATSNKEAVTRNCMLIVQGTGHPLWHFWQSTNVPVEVRCAFHPVKQLAVWSPSAHELCIMHLTSGKVQSTILPEPADITFSSVTDMRKEFQFSDSGHSLYYLLYTAMKKEASLQHTVSISSFHFSTSDSEDCFLRRMYPTHTVSYEHTGLIQQPLTLTSWTSSHLYIALPPLSCNAKILRLRLPHGGYSGKPASEGFQTLRNSVYFPYSTPYRNPQIKVLDREEGKETFTLALDAEFSSAARLDNTRPVMRQPPALMTWDLDRKEDWRDWESSVDGRSEELRAGRHTYDMLRGTFVDADKRFNVPIRSGLDWRKKAFLSCA
jgi:hypothetical protein